MCEYHIFERVQGKLKKECVASDSGDYCLFEESDSPLAPIRTNEKQALSIKFVSLVEF